MTILSAPGPIVRTRSAARFSALRIPVPVLVSFIIVAVVIGWSAFPGLFTNYDPVSGVPADKLQAPSLTHWFGTDHLGRDLYTRVVYGAASSVTSAFLAVSIGLFTGGFIGLLAGFLGGWVDIVLARLVDFLLSIPRFLLAVIIVTALGFDTMNAAIATGVWEVAVFARVMRAEVIKTRQATFVEAAFLSGGSNWHILTRHVLPNASRSILPLAVLQFGLSILVIAGLAFLGYGDPPPASDWGLLISIGKDYLKWPWLVYAPALVTIATVLSVNRISRWLRKTD
ncbi:ABC-type transporter, integral membrane subunit [Rhizobium sp. PDO1-076]|uniref:ABC transporter permease n=1 Tax=Rhizobium sp. PDO1-076 TaxID=1125979 RepID=UPI00024E3ADA|nr:ABC transporter permease [Rhizobium sp. PDO1-076]EHS52628.1 ABC-type transporter, integral membrane subunit [Rhizobium sp. PDO1-076]